MIKLLILLLCLSSVSLNAVQAVGEPMVGKEKTQLCAGCHSVDGNSSVAQWPSLAGQNERYLIKQMLDYQSGQAGGRYDPTMTPLMQDLSLEDMADIAAYYASQPTEIGAVDPELLARGQQIYRGGDFEKQITACIVCHSPNGLGNADAGFPALSGQQPEYVITQLIAYKEGARANDYNHIMRDIAGRMDLKDIQAVASYVYGLY